MPDSTASTRFRPLPPLEVLDPGSLTSTESVIAHLRAYGETEHPLFSWPTDACGYDQHIRFVRHLNAHYNEITDLKAFVRDYADALEEELASV